MTPHEYAVIGHKRSEVGRWLGLGAVLFAPLITSLLTWTGQLPFLNESVQGKLATFTVSTGLVYGVLYWIFDRHGWRWIDRFLKIPNLSGKWEIQGTTIGQDQKPLVQWQRMLTITQTWDRMAIEMNTGQSKSYSESASLVVKHNNEAKLSYSYQNHPNAGEPGLEKHQGFCELVFGADYTTAEGYYFNSLGRYTFGRLILKKISS